MPIRSQRIRSLLPFLEWLPGVDRGTLKADLSAGLTGAVVVLPQGVAFAAIAGMPPQYGLYAAMVPAVVAALFGSSRHLVSGPTTAASIVLFSALAALAIPGSAEYVALAITLTFMVGVTQLALGIARLGTLVNFISHSVIVGFTAGAAVLIATSQLRHFFGIDIPRSLSFDDRIVSLLSRLDEANPYALAVGVATLATGIAIRRISRRWPYMIIALLAGSLVSLAIGRWLGERATGIDTVGALPATLPPMSAPRFDLATVRELAPAVLAMTLFALTEAVSIARALAIRSGQLIDGNREFIGQGLSNIIGSFFSAYVATGSFNRSGVNYEAGARTPLAAVFAAAILIVLVVLVAPLAAWLPNAAMAAILFMVAWGLVDLPHIRHIARASRAEFSVLAITFVSTLVLDLEFAILLGVLASLVVYLRRTSRPSMSVCVPDPRTPERRMSVDPALPECPQLRIQRLDGSIWFGAVQSIDERWRSQLRRHPLQKHLLLMMQGVNFVDVAGAELLAAEAGRRQRAGGGLYLYGLKPGVCEPLTRGGYYRTIGAENTFDSKREALGEIIGHLDMGICERCDVRVFLECRRLPGGPDHRPADDDGASAETDGGR